MSALMHHVAGAALPVAIGLLVLAAVARGALWAGAEAAQALARKYLEPLGSWCLVAVAVDVVALAAANDATVLSFAPPLVLGAVAAALRATPETESRPEVAPASEPSAPAPPAGGALWAEPVEVKLPDKGLWDRS